MKEEDPSAKNELSRRNFLKTGATAAAAFAGAQAAITTTASPAVASSIDDTSGTLVFVNGRIHTMDAGNSIV